MISDARGGHVSPGIYTEVKDVTYAAKSLGITSLGLAGETLKGPAFQATPISDWAEYTDYFGPTSTETFKGTGYPKYELPYIAKEYLKESKQLYVTRVLGLSGYDAGSAYTICLKVNDKTYPLAVLRSKGEYSFDGTETICDTTNYETFHPYVKGMEITGYKKNKYNADCTISPETEEIGISGLTPAINGQLYFGDKEVEGFGLIISAGTNSAVTEVKTYNVSLRDTDANYIYKIFSVDPNVGEAPVYVEEVFDLAYKKEIIDAAYLSATCELTKVVSNAEADYKDYFRCAVTPWIVSNVKSATEKEMTLKKLFKFYTISDGNAANRQVKVSIQNIRPEKGLFDVVVRDYYDFDYAPVILEKFTNCTLVEGETGYIGLKIGTADGVYEAKSKYITVFINNEEDITDCVPAGFLGYPIPKFGATEKIDVAYNTVKTDAKPKRQYFGLNRDILDEDILSYKGLTAYDNVNNDATPEKLVNGFHLDAILSVNSAATTYVDGVSGFVFTTVSAVQDGIKRPIPRIFTEAYMKQTIYEDTALRKFTVYPYGGFDGWDIYRTERTNTAEYKANKYIIPASGACPFKGIASEDLDLNLTLNLNLPDNAITSDYYAYLAGYRQYANPNDIAINIFATPGIDWVNNEALVEDALDMIEDKEEGRAGDALYVITTPQTNAENGTDYKAEDIKERREDSDIDSCLGCTYYPWAKVYDTTERKYINLPTTKDVVRNMAYTDNNAYPWFAPAGVSRGNVECVKAYFKTTLTDEDTLYDVAINPVKTFAVDGVKIWGNKTLYSIDSPLNRINVVRFMLRLKKLVTDAAKVLIFDQYDLSLEKQFRSLVEPILADAKSNRGIVDYRVVTECTAETRDQHILPAKILVKPTPTLEYIPISFTVYPEGVEFED